MNRQAQIAKLAREQAEEVARERRRRWRPAPAGEAATDPLALVADDGAADPLDVLIEAEATEATVEALAKAPVTGFARRVGQAFVPPPRLLLGSNRLQWEPGLEGHRGANCPVCHGCPLALFVYCLACGRSGSEHLLEKIPRHERPKPYKPDAAGLAGGIGQGGAKKRSGRRGSVYDDWVPSGA
jgi:hypothetical protein